MLFTYMLLNTDYNNVNQIGTSKWQYYNPLGTIAGTFNGTETELVTFLNTLGS